MLEHIKKINRFIPSKLYTGRVFILSAAVFGITALLLILCFPICDGLKLLFFLGYMTVSNTVIPLPTPQFVVYYGEMFNPLLIALVGGIGTCIACLVEYTLLLYAFKYTAEKSEKLAGLKNTKTYQYAIRIFNKAPFISIVIAGFTPIPFDPIRLMAIAARYNRVKYSLSIFIGRAPRYFLLAYLGERLTSLECNLHINAFLFGTILVVIVIFFIIRKIFRNIRKG